MTKLRKIMPGMLFAFILAMGISAQSNNAQAATTKNFKGNLNATYKSSEWKSKISFKKISAKEVTVKVVAAGINQGKFKGKIISKNTIKMKLDTGEIIKLKWKNKSSFTAKSTNGFDSETVQMVRLLCYSLNNTKYKQIKKSDTVYYEASVYSDYFGELGKDNPAIFKISFKKNKMIIIGSFSKSSKRKNLYTGKAKYLPVDTRTFKINSKTKFYAYEENYKYKVTKKQVSDFSAGPAVTITVKKGIVTLMDFSA